MSSSNCCFLTCIQVSQEAGQVVWYSHFQNLPQFIVIHTVKGFGIVNKAEIDVFLELSCFFYDPAGVGNLISGSSAFSKTSLNIWKFTVHVLLKPGLENFEHYFSSHLQIFVTLWTVAHQAPLTMIFPRQEYWSGWPFPPPGDLPDPEIKPTSPAFPALAGRFFTTEPPGKPINPLPIFSLISYNWNLCLF